MRGISFLGAKTCAFARSVVMGRTRAIGDSPDVRIELRAGDGRRGAQGGNLRMHEPKRPRPSL